MPAWGIHLYTAKKLKERIKVKDYNNFLIGNLVTDINNGYVVKDISKIIKHKDTHYYVEDENGRFVCYNIEKFIIENKQNLNNVIVLGYIVHLLTDAYWNTLTYDKHGLYDEKNELIGIKLNNGTDLIINAEGRRRIKQNDFKIFANYMYINDLIDIPTYDDKVYELIKEIKQIELTKEDIKKTIDYLNEVKKGFKLEVEEYKIFTQKEMEENVELCIDYITNYLKKRNINL